MRLTSPGLDARWGYGAVPVNFVTTLKSLGPRYTALWVGQTISQFGTYVAWLTLPFLVAYIQGIDLSALDFSLAYALETAPTILVGLIGGVLLDRWHLRPVMIATDLVRAGAFFYLAANLDSYGTFTVFVVAFLIGSMTTFFDSALYALIPSIVPEERLVDGNGLVAASQQANFALGPLAAGLFAAATGGPALGLFINGATFVLSAISLYWVGRVAHPGLDEDSQSSFLHETANGLRYIWSEPRLRVTTIAVAIPNFVTGFIEATIVVLAYTVFGVGSDAQVGIVVASMGVGGVIGALVAPGIAVRLGVGKTMTVGMGILGVGMVAWMYTEFGVFTLTLSACWMFGLSMVNVPLATIRQHYSAPAMIGRVISASRAIGWATLPIGALIGGWLGNNANHYPIVARSFPLLLVPTALWLMTTVVWRDTYGPAQTPPDAALGSAE